MSKHVCACVCARRVQVSVRVLEIDKFMNSKRLFKDIRKRGKAQRPELPVMVHINYHPVSSGRSRAVAARARRAACAEACVYMHACTAAVQCLRVPGGACSGRSRARLHLHLPTRCARCGACPPHFAV